MTPNEHPRSKWSMTTGRLETGTSTTCADLSLRTDPDSRALSAVRVHTASTNMPFLEWTWQKGSGVCDTCLLLASQLVFSKSSKSGASWLGLLQTPNGLKMAEKLGCSRVEPTQGMNASKGSKGALDSGRCCEARSPETAANKS